MKTMPLLNKAEIQQFILLSTGRLKIWRLGNRFIKVYGPYPSPLAGRLK